MFAIPSKDGVDITKGKKYEIIEMFRDEAFRLVSDSGIKFFCLKEDCAHLSGGDWELVDE